jgi:hypothetical protein
MESIKRGEEELRDNLLKLEKQLADALNLQSEYEKEKREYDGNSFSIIYNFARIIATFNCRPSQQSCKFKSKIAR